MGADIGDLPLIQHHDLIRTLGGGDTLSHDDLGAGEVQVGKLLLDVFFCFQVHSGGGIVQDQNGRTHRQGAGQGDTLFLTTGQTGATFANEGVEAVGQFFHKVHVRHFSVALHVLFRQGTVTVGDVAVHRIGEQEHVLGSDTDRVAQSVEIIQPHRGTVDGQGAVGHIGETRDQVHQRGLAGTGGSHDGHSLPGLDVQVDVPQNRHTMQIQIHSFEVDLPLHAGIHRLGVGARCDGRLGVVQLDDLGGAGEEPLEIIQVHAQHTHGVGQRPGKGVE
ncbi:putative uncharacterized protein [Clostridium sp. CAG:1013]|nr:putative uncharacterized protein [Clostridium sp. CAG:1013]